MKTVRFRFLSLFCLLALVLTLAACSAGGSASMNGSVYPTDKGNGGSSFENGLVGDVNYPTGAKLIKTVRVSAYTLEYDEVLDAITTAISDLGAYTSTEKHETSYYGGSRSLYVIVKVPADKLEDFLAVLQDEADVTSLTSDVADVTLTYQTLVAKRDTLLEEKAVVESYYEKAEKEGATLTELQKLGERLLALRTEINELNAQITVYDNLVAYSTVHLNLYEKQAPVVPEKKGAFARIGESFVTNLKDIGNGFVELFIFLIGGLPYFVLLGGIGVGVYFLFRYLRKKLPFKKAQKKDSDTHAEDTESCENENS